MMELTADEMRKRTQEDMGKYVSALQEEMLKCKPGAKCVWMTGIPKNLEKDLQHYFENLGFVVSWDLDYFYYRKIIVSWEKPRRKKWWQR